MYICIERERDIRGAPEVGRVEVVARALRRGRALQPLEPLHGALPAPPGARREAQARPKIRLRRCDVSSCYRLPGPPSFYRLPGPRRRPLRHHASTASSGRPRLPISSAEGTGNQRSPRSRSPPLPPKIRGLLTMSFACTPLLSTRSHLPWLWGAFSRTTVRHGLQPAGSLWRRRMPSEEPRDQ